ncbi:type I restriction enzyme HsdR N-terminal domain-containing protein [Massilia sp. H6]|uniref:type I restriction enzyme HsdR N-terminal domain-containing protein n=1 Tax=Massilia sp. H6 TaxID=2970464 RepID=UPI0021671228|nr:type I restriction enzyme HsdR N-terminal domain-containing protein [Massilia sp. H6]UVW30722.1 type I restriction enzyme HsdR N-terminal domain-containing protein [Massilia sp. H6]
MITNSNDINASTEEDVRTKVVFPWLLSQGFTLDQISLERSFSVRLGHAILNVENGTIRKKTSAPKNKEEEKEKENTKYSGRADMVVRNRQGRNLMVIEVKAPHIKLTDDDRDQAISYARLLEGDIAPISVVTNGVITRVFDTFTRDEIRENSIDLQNFCENPKALSQKNYLDLRAEALESLLSLSEENLLSFCEGQIEHRMRPLYSDDLNSGKKFIPELYVARAHAQENLHRLLDIEKRPVVLLVGPPQVGKTNFVCHAVRERLKQGHPPLFYPAIGLDAGLFSSLLDDFQWVSAKDINGAQEFLRKLHNILRISNKRLVILAVSKTKCNTLSCRVPPCPESIPI